MKKIPIAAGIYREGNVLIAEVRAGSSRDGTQTRQRERFPLGTELRVIIAWQHGAKRDLLRDRPPAPAAGSLASDVPAYLETLPEGRYRTESTFLLEHWASSPLGRMARAAIVRLEIVGQISRWLEAGVAAATVNKRLSRLRKLFHALDGPDVAAPTDAIKFLREPKREPRDIPTRTIGLILESLPDQGRPERGKTRPEISVTKIRLRVIALTGIPPATLQRVRPRDLDLAGAQVYLRPRRKGHGTEGAWIALLPAAVDAFRAFAAAGLFGRAYSNSSIGKTWRVGIARAMKTAARYAQDTGDPSWVTDLANLPPRCKPYDLRHSFGSEMYRRTGDILAVSELLQHSTLEMTKRYTKGAVSERVAAAIAKATPAYTNIPTIPPAATLRLVKPAGR